MKVDCPTTPVIYALPKIHKSMTPPLPGRPIVSSNGSLTGNICTFVDFFIKPWAISLPTYTRDSIDFIKKFKSVDHIPENSILCTFHVTSLYTNIPHQGCLENLKFYLNEWTQEELLKFHAYLNSMNEHLHFTINYDLSQISFLDVMVIKDKTSLFTDLYRNPTDRNTLLRGDRFYPHPLMKSLPISQFSRIKRICSSDASYQKQTTDLTQRFKERGYKDNWIPGRSARAFRQTGSARAFRQTGSARAFRQTGSARAFRQTGSARAFRQTGSARAFRQTGAARAFRQTGSARAFRQTGAARAFRQTGSARAFRQP
ncbi:unnamed protein product [Coregonus sp. 'balchen']|nr:unnamed protein product [Coregonus sp. 'balchen']